MAKKVKKKAIVTSKKKRNLQVERLEIRSSSRSLFLSTKMRKISIPVDYTRIRTCTSFIQLERKKKNGLSLVPKQPI